MAELSITKVRSRPRAATATKPSAPSMPGAAQAETARVRATSAALRPSDPEFWIVINEVTDPTPIVPTELDAIERYFSAVLDDVFGSSRKTSP